MRDGQKERVHVPSAPSSLWLALLWIKGILGTVGIDRNVWIEIGLLPHSFARRIGTGGDRGPFSIVVLGRWGELIVQRGGGVVVVHMVIGKDERGLMGGWKREVDVLLWMGRVLGRWMTLIIHNFLAFWSICTVLRVKVVEGDGGRQERGSHGHLQIEVVMGVHRERARRGECRGEGLRCANSRKRTN